MARIPTKPEILDWLAEHPAENSKRDIARAFGIKGAERIELKRLLRELEDEGHLEKRNKTYRDPDSLPPVSLLRLEAPDRSGDLFATPLEWHGEAEPPRVLFLSKPTDPALSEGDRILGRLKKVDGEDHAYEARLIRRIGHAPRKILGIYRTGAEGGRIVPIDKGADLEWRVSQANTAGARDGELVEAEQAGPKGRMGLPVARIVTRLGDPGAAKAVSLIAIHQHGIPDEFDEEIIAEADRCKPVPLGKREDLRDLPLITIDPVDARDHDDAVHAHADDDPANPGGHVIWVAIADVAAYVKPDSALDLEARRRGNSSYFPDRVVPMLPDRLSGDLCSIHEDVPRPCLAVRMVLDSEGNKIAQRFTRGMMRSHASLTYDEVQAAVDGSPNDRTAPLLETVLIPLYDAYRALCRARDRRQPLDLDLPERKIELSDQGEVTSVRFRDRHDAHRLIEECMVLANVAAAEELIKRRQPLLFRVHEEPSQDKLEALRDVAHASGLSLAKGQVLQTAHLNRLLKAAEATDFDELINLSTLRSMTQAYYSPENFGHFGLALQAYAHFTSPIRRYADLIVHRALIRAHGWGEDGLTADEIEDLQRTAEHISNTERRSMAAERDTNDRYLATYLSDRVGNEFSARISGVVKFGAFAKLDETGADGLIPVRSLGREFFRYDKDEMTLTGVETGLTLAVGMRVTVRLAEAVPVTGGLELDLLAIDNEPVRQGRRGHGGRGKGPRRAPAKAHRNTAKVKAKSKRQKLKR